MQPAEVAEIAQLILAAIQASRVSCPLKLQLYATLYNMTPFTSLDSRFAVFMQMLDVAHEGKQLDRLEHILSNFTERLAAWEITTGQKREVLAKLAAISESTSDAEAAQHFRVEYLRTFQGEPHAVLQTARDVACAAALGYIRTPVTSQKSELPSFDAVKALESDAEFSHAWALLRVFAQGVLSDLDAFFATPGAKEWMVQVGIKEEAVVETMRLLTLTSTLAGRATVSFTEIAEATSVCGAAAAATAAASCGPWALALASLHACVCVQQTWEG